MCDDCDRVEELARRAWAVTPDWAREDLRKVDEIARPLYERSVIEQIQRPNPLLERLTRRP